MGSKTKRSADQKPPPPLWVEDAHADLLQRRITTTGKELFVYIADLFSGPGSWAGTRGYGSNCIWFAASPEGELGGGARVRGRFPALPSPCPAALNTFLLSALFPSFVFFFFFSYLPSISFHALTLF